MVNIVGTILDVLIVAALSGRPWLHQGAVFTGLEATLQGLAHARRPRRSTLARCHRRLTRPGLGVVRRRRDRGSRGRGGAGRDGSAGRLEGVVLLVGDVRGLVRGRSLMMMMAHRSTFRSRSVESRALAATRRHRPAAAAAAAVAFPRSRNLLRSAKGCESHGFGERWRARDRSSTACRLRLPSDD